MALDRSCSPIVELRSSKLRDGFFLLLENGAVTIRLRKNLFTVGLSSTPMTASMSLLSRSISSSSVNHHHQQASDNLSDIYNSVTEIHYEQKAVSEAIRLSKHAKTLSLALNPVSETHAAILASDGKVFMLELKVNSKRKTSQRPSVTIEDLIPPTVENSNKDLSLKPFLNNYSSL